MIGHHAAFFCRDALMEFDVAARHAEAALSLAQQLGARRFETEALAFRAELHRRAGRRAKALADAEAAVRISRETGMGFLGPFALGALALASNDPAARWIALEEAEALLGAGAVSHTICCSRAMRSKPTSKPRIGTASNKPRRNWRNIRVGSPCPSPLFTSRGRARCRPAAAAGATRRRSTAFATRPSGWVFWPRSPASRRPSARRAVDFGAPRKFPCCSQKFLCKTPKIPLHSGHRKSFNRLITLRS